jgi:hypothetical protein
MTDDEWHSQVPRREGESLEHYEARIRYHERLSDWSEPGAVKVYLDGKVLEPTMEPN